MITNVFEMVIILKPSIPIILNMKALILIVEDDIDLLELLEHRLQKENYETVGLESTRLVKKILETEPIDLIIMDRNLPGVEGSAYISLLRDEGMETPVMFLSAKNTKTDIQDGFLCGGDDYMTKPFEVKELLLRVEAILRRTSTPPVKKKSLTYREITLDIKQRLVYIKSQPMELTKLEFNLLHTFIENQGSVLNREFLLKTVWGSDKLTQKSTVNVAMKRLKEKIAAITADNYIKTVRGIGYTIQ